MEGTLFKRVVLLLLLITFSLPIAAQQPISNPVLEPMIDSIAKDLVTENSPGFVIGVIEKGEFTFLKAYGLADIENNIPVTTETLFDIGSVTKQFTAMCIALLANEGKLSLDDNIREYIPEMPDYGKPITINHLIHHTSGLRDFSNLMLLKGMDLHNAYSMKELLQLITRQKALNFEPGEKYLYCNTGYLLLAEILKRVTGKSLAEFARENIFQPLGMKNTVWISNKNDKLPKNRAVGYRRDGNNFKKIKDISKTSGGAGGIQINAEDMRLWLNNYSEKKVGNDAVMNMINTRGVLNNGDTIAYSFGLVNSKYLGLTKISHDGGTGNFHAKVERYPDINLSMLFFTNCNYMDGDRLLRAVVETLTKDEIESANKEKAVQTSLLNSYAGLYKMDNGFSIDITEENGKLFSQGAGQSKCELFASSDTSFYLKVVEASIDFHPEPDGKVNIFTLHQSGHNIDFKRATKKDETNNDTNIDATILKRYVGDYAMNSSFKIAITLEAGKLFGQGTGQPKFELFAKSDTSFFLKAVEASIDFHVSEDGSVNMFTLHQGGHDVPFNRVTEEPSIPKNDFDMLPGDYYSEDLDVTYHIIKKDNKLILEAPEFGDILPTPATTALEYVEKDKYTAPLRDIRIIRDDGNVITGFYLDFGRAANIEFIKK